MRCPGRSQTSSVLVRLALTAVLRLATVSLTSRLIALTATFELQQTADYGRVGSRLRHSKFLASGGWPTATGQYDQYDRLRDGGSEMRREEVRRSEVMRSKAHAKGLHSEFQTRTDRDSLATARISLSCDQPLSRSER